ncbi:SMI1/KNR4 family protein [Streptomyces sp. R28]|uniref:SMI1/KNR4 family protein n=1 Tax=Streptomyces sp. R28 TaxID=3238628 RepID=A0AB39Q4Z2_9ACTN
MGAIGRSGVRERVQALARADEAREVFGAWDRYGGVGHHFWLADPLSEAEVAEAEAQWGISLPVEYRAFLLEVGAGGAGPGYGLTTLGRTDAGWLWSDPGRGTVHERLSSPFPGGEESVRAQAEHERKEPVESGFADEAAFHEAYRTWLEADERLYDWFSSGAVCLSHEGCGYLPLAGRVRSAAGASVD